MLSALPRAGPRRLTQGSRSQPQHNQLRPHVSAPVPFQRARRRPSTRHRAAAAGGGDGGGGSGNGGSGNGGSGNGGNGGGSSSGRGDYDTSNNNNSARLVLIAGAVAAAATAAAIVACSSGGGERAAAAAAPPPPPPRPSLPPPLSLSLATSDDVAALKRLLRESFEAQLHARRRLDGLEQAAAEMARAAAADDPREAADEVVPGARGGLSFAAGARERRSPGARATGQAGCRGMFVRPNGPRGDKGGRTASDADAASATTARAGTAAAAAQEAAAAAAAAAAATLRWLGAGADAGVSMHVHHHSPGAGHTSGRGRGAATGEAEDEAAAVGAAAGAGGPDATALVAAAAAAEGGAPFPGGGGEATSRQRRRQQQQQPWHSRDRRITLRLSSSLAALDDDAGAVGGGEQGDAGAAAALSARQLLVRLRPFDWLQLMAAPLGGSLAALARPPAPLVAVASAARGPGAAATRALRQGHDLSALRLGGAGHAASVCRGAVSLAVGHFAAPSPLPDGGGGGGGGGPAASGPGGSEEAGGGWRPPLGGGLRATTAAQLALHPRDGESAVAVLLARVAEGRDSGGLGVGGGGGGALGGGEPPPPFLGTAAALGLPSDGGLSRAVLMPWLPAARSSYVLGASWSAPVGDALAATAWAERRVGGQDGGGDGGDGGGGGGGGSCGGHGRGSNGAGGGWGVSLRTRADGGGGPAGGPELAVVLSRASTAVRAAATGRGTAAALAAAGGDGGGSADRGGAQQKGPIYCEVSARLSAGDGVSVTPGAIVTLGGEAPLVAYTIAGSWRF